MSLLSVLSCTAIVTTISLFFCGLPIIWEIWRRRSTRDISGFPFLAGFLGGSFWMRYGFLKGDFTMISVNCVGVTMMFLYLIFYTYYAENKMSMFAQLAAVLLIISAMLVAVEIYQMAIIDVLGFVSMTFNVINFGAPLVGMKLVLQKRCCETLPLPLCTANLLVSSQWAVYGTLVNDPYIIIPNCAGSVLALLQIALFLVFPRRHGTRAPLGLCFSWAEWEFDDKPSVDEMEKGGANNVWLDRQATLHQSLPPTQRGVRAKKGGLSLMRSTNVFPSGSVSSRTESAATAVTTLPNWSLTPSVSQPDISEPASNAASSTAATRASPPADGGLASLERPDRPELKRISSAPLMAESTVPLPPPTQR